MGKPVKSFKCGAVEAAIFENQTAKGVMRNTVLSKRYRASDGEWKSTNSLGINDIPKAIKALDKAYEFQAMKGDAGEGSESNGEDE